MVHQNQNFNFDEFFISSFSAPFSLRVYFCVRLPHRLKALFERRKMQFTSLMIYSDLN